MKLQKIGGVAAIASIFVWFSAVLIYHYSGLPDDPVKAMEAYSAAPAPSNICLVLIEACSLLLMVFFLALHERMHAGAPYLTRIMLIAISAAAAMGIMEVVIWITGMQLIAPVRDASAYRALDAIFNGLHNAGGHAGMWAVLFAGWAIIKTKAFRPILGWLLLGASILAIPKFLIPQIGLVKPVYIAYAVIIWIGMELIRGKTSWPTDRNRSSAI